ncbi:hypothetical protein Rs2_10927 [Raphanus sativus]|nr:hypothetical protein Rs2_10927 [Raphanus sativus]
MATTGGVLVCLLIAALDVAAAILGIQAEVAQNQYTNLGLSDCREPSNDAFRRGLGAIAMLVIAQISMVCLVSTWIVVVVAFLTLVIGTLTNSKSSSSCGLTHLHFLSVGGILCFLHALLCAAYYASATAAKDEAAKDEAAKPISV